MQNVIYKYKNRKLYSAKKGGYVTKADIMGMMVNGVELSVLDRASGEDITKRTLAGVLMSSPLFLENVDVGQLMEIAQSLKDVPQESSEEISEELLS
jgi:polyhydroxyalkanoate synthesis regulator protein